MKTIKSITVLAAVLVTSSLLAQPEKGDKMIIGNLSMDFYNSFSNQVKTDARGGMNADLLLGWVLGKGYVVGGGIHYGNYFDTDFDAQGDKTNRSIMHGVGPVIFTRHYMRLADKFYMRSGTNIAYTANLSRSKLFPSKDKTDISFSNQFDIAIRLGLVVFPKPNVGIEFSYGELYYNANFSHVLDGTPEVSNHVGFRYGVDGIQVGLVVLLKKKEKGQPDKK